MASGGLFPLTIIINERGKNMFDLQVMQEVATISTRRNGKALKLTRVVVNDCPEQWDLAFWQDGNRKGGVIMTDHEFDGLIEVLKDM